MDLLKLPLSNDSLTFTHANNTLIVSYSKPQKVLQAVRKGGRGGGFDCDNVPWFSLLGVL